MTKDEALKMALDALELYQSKISVQMFDDAAAAIREVLAQPERHAVQGEPVICQHKRYSIDTYEQTGNCIDCGAEGRMKFVVGDATSQPAVPASKPWVGLTEDERRHLRKCNQQHDAFALAIEAKLMEKNA